MFPPIIHQFIHQLPDTAHPVETAHVGPAEEETLFHIALHGLDEGVGDAVRHLGRLAGFETAGAVLRREAQALLKLLHQRSGQRTARHSHRAVDDAHILGLGRQQDVFIGLAGVALVVGMKRVASCAPAAPIFV